MKTAAVSVRRSRFAFLYIGQDLFCERLPCKVKHMCVFEDHLSPVLGNGLSECFKELRSAGLRYHDVIAVGPAVGDVLGWVRAPTEMKSTPVSA